MYYEIVEVKDDYNEHQHIVDSYRCDTSIGYTISKHKFDLSNNVVKAYLRFDICRNDIWYTNFAFHLIESIVDGSGNQIYDKRALWNEYSKSREYQNAMDMMLGINEQSYKICIPVYCKYFPNKIIINIEALHLLSKHACKLPTFTLICDIQRIDSAVAKTL